MCREIETVGLLCGLTQLLSSATFCIFVIWISNEKLFGSQKSHLTLVNKKLSSLLFENSKEGKAENKSKSVFDPWKFTASGYLYIEHASNTRIHVVPFAFRVNLLNEKVNVEWNEVMKLSLDWILVMERTFAVQVLIFLFKYLCIRNFAIHFICIPLSIALLVMQVAWSLAITGFVFHKSLLQKSQHT